MNIKNELITAKLAIEKKLALKVIELAQEPIDAAFYHVICNEIKFLAGELIRISFEVDTQEYQERLQEAQDELK